MYVSPQVESLLGSTLKGIRGLHEAWCKAIHPEDQSRVVKELSRAYANGATFLLRPAPRFQFAFYTGPARWN